MGLSLLFFACKKPAPNTIANLCPETFDVNTQMIIGAAVNQHIKNDPDNFPILSETTYQEAYQYLNQLFFSMVNTEPVTVNGNHYDWHINIIDNDSMRTAFFVPGGEFYIYTGMLKFLDAEHQLLTIIAHELYYASSELIPETIKEKEIVKCIQLGDIILGRDIPESADIAAALPTMSFETSAVMEADSFAIDILCPFLYEPLGIREIILKASESIETLHWLQYRSANIEYRIQEASRMAAPCDLGGVRNEDAYLDFLFNMLP